MNYPLLRYLFGMILLIVAAFLVLPLAVAVIYGESSGIYFLYTMIAAGLLGFLLTRSRPQAGPCTPGKDRLYGAGMGGHFPDRRGALYPVRADPQLLRRRV